MREFVPGESVRGYIREVLLAKAGNVMTVYGTAVALYEGDTVHKVYHRFQKQRKVP